MSLSANVKMSIGNSEQFEKKISKKKNENVGIAAPTQNFEKKKIVYNLVTIKLIKTCYLHTQN